MSQQQLVINKAHLLADLLDGREFSKKQYLDAKKQYETILAVIRDLEQEGVVPQRAVPPGISGGHSCRCDYANHGYLLEECDSCKEYKIAQRLLSEERNRRMNQAAKGLSAMPLSDIDTQAQ